MLNCVNALEPQIPGTEQASLMVAEEKSQPDSCKNHYTNLQAVFIIGRQTKSHSRSYLLQWKYFQNINHYEYVCTYTLNTRVASTKIFIYIPTIGTLYNHCIYTSRFLFVVMSVYQLILANK